MSSSSQPATKSKKWFPLESNPSLLNKYITKLGFDTSLYEFVDVYSTEPWALEMISVPVAAVIMLYPLSEVQEKYRKQEKSDQEKNNISKPNVWFVKQRIGNACGTIGVLHALANVPTALKESTFVPSSWICNYLTKCSLGNSGDPVLNAEVLENDETIEKYHDAATCDNVAQTNRGDIDQDIDTHFVALVHVDGGLYELDGRKDGPIFHGATNEINLLSDACKVVKKFMERDPEELRFTIVALAPKHVDK